MIATADYNNLFVSGERGALHRLAREFAARADMLPNDVTVTMHADNYYQRMTIMLSYSTGGGVNTLQVDTFGEYDMRKLEMSGLFDRIRQRLMDRADTVRAERFMLGEVDPPPISRLGVPVAHKRVVASS